MYNYPYGDNQQINLNWIISEIIALHQQLDPDYTAPTFTQIYPFSETQQLNLDWILTELKALKELAPTPSPTEAIDEVGQALIAGAYDATKTYQQNDYIVQDGKVYRANAATTGTFDPTKWREVMLGDDLAIITRWVDATNTYLNNLEASNVSNDSSVAGATVKDALNNLNDTVNQISTTFDFYNPNAVYRIANNQGVAREGYTFNADDTVTVTKDYSGYGSAYAFNDSLLLTPGLYTVTAYVQTSNLNPSLSSAVRVKLGLSSVDAQYPTLTTTRGGNTPISQGDNAGWLTATFEITEEETFCFLIMPNAAAWNPLTISNLSITGITAYDADARTNIINLNNAVNTLQTDFSGETAISAESGLFTTSKFFRTTANISLGSTGVTLPAYSRGLVISNTGVTGAIIATEYNGKTIVAFFDNSAIVTANSLFDNKNLQDVTPTMKNCTVTYATRQCKYKYLSNNMLYVWARCRGQITAVDSSPYALIDISTVPGILDFEGNYASVTIRESENCCETLPYSALASKSGQNMYVQFQKEGGTTAARWKVTPSGGTFYANISAIFIKP